MNSKKLTAGEILLSDGWFDSDAEALPWIILRKVLADDKPVTSLSQKLPRDAVIRVKEYYKKRYVNKGGLKLERAIQTFGIVADGVTALDCGASTGGFTDCLLQHGAAKVYAVDAGFGQLAGKLLNEQRIVNMENTNIADVRLRSLEPKPSLVTLDLSYLSLTKAIPLVREFAAAQHTVICLIKPNFEVVGADSSGVISDRDTLIAILKSLLAFFKEDGYSVNGLINSPVTGSGGAYEFLACLDNENDADTYIDLEAAVDNALNTPKFNYNNIDKDGLIC